MKKILSLLLLLPLFTFSQNVGISGDINFIPSTTFDIDGGLRIRNFNSGVIVSNSTGLLNSTNGTAGQVLGSGPTWVDPKTFSWTINGNDNTSVSTNFIGTINNTGMAFRTNGVERMRLQSDGQLTIGSTQPGGRLDVHQSSDNDVARFTTYANVNRILLRRAQTSGGTLTATSTSGTVLGRFDFEGYNGSSYTSSARIESALDATGGTSTDMPGRLSFWTTPDGSGTMIERLRISNNGNVGIGSLSPTSKLEVIGSASGQIESSIFGELDITDGEGIGVVGVGGYNGVQGNVFPLGNQIYYGASGNVISTSGIGTNIGIYGRAEGGGTNYAGYFLGDVLVTGLSGGGIKGVAADNNGLLVASNVPPGSVVVPIGCSSATTSTITEDFESGNNGWTLTPGTGAVRIGTEYGNCSSAGSCITGNARGGSNALQFQLCANNCNNCIWAEKSFDFGPAGGSFSFWYKRGTESCCDYLRVFVDGVQINQWSGCSNTWTQATVSGVSPGNHTIRFAMITDGSVISNGGRAQVDDLVITKSNLPTISSCVQTTQRIIRGNVNADATVSSGGGFICTRPSTGIYLVTFVQAFSDAPTVVATQVGSGDTRDNALVYDITSTSFRVKVGDSGGNVSNRPFTFIAMGSE